MYCSPNSYSSSNFSIAIVVVLDFFAYVYKNLIRILDARILFFFQLYVQLYNVHLYKMVIDFILKTNYFLIGTFNFLKKVRNRFSPSFVLKKFAFKICVVIVLSIVPLRYCPKYSTPTVFVYIQQICKCNLKI